MGLVEMFLGKENPFSQYVADNRNKIHGAFAGLGQGANVSAGMGSAALGAQRGGFVDDVATQQRAEEEKRIGQINQTAQFLRAKGAEDLAAAVEGGMTSGADAFNQWYQQANAPVEQIKPIEVNGQLVNPMTGEVLGDYRDPQASGPSLSGMPSNYQEYVLSTQDPGYADFRTNAPAAAKPPTEAERKASALTTVTQQDAALLFGNGTPEQPGIFEALGNGWDQTKSFGAFGINPLAGTASSDFKVAKDAISNITQSYLYAMSGATAPPEEVRKISEQVTPQPLDSPDQKRWKRERLLAMYQAIEGAQGNAAPSGNGGDGWEVVGVQ